jgi:hypothetical protein
MILEQGKTARDYFSQGSYGENATAWEAEALAWHYGEHGCAGSFQRTPFGLRCLVCGREITNFGPQDDVEKIDS